MMSHLQMRLHDGVADALLGQAQTLADTGKQDEAEKVWPPPPLLAPLCAPDPLCAQTLCARLQVLCMHLMAAIRRGAGCGALVSPPISTIHPTGTLL